MVFDSVYKLALCFALKPPRLINDVSAGSVGLGPCMYTGSVVFYI
jgi:hypothetical protein